MGPPDADVTREEMRLPNGEVQHRFLGELQTDEVFGASVMLVGLDAAEEADALRRVHEGIAVGEFAEVERPADRGADGGAASGQDGERAFPPAEKLTLGEQEQAVLEETGQLAGRDDHAAAEASVQHARGEAADLGRGDVGFEPVDGAVGIPREQAGPAVLGQRGGGAEQGGACLGTVGGRADQERFGRRGFERERGVAERSVVGLLEHELVDLRGVKLGAKDVFVAAVD